jgi:lipoprotein-releasing system ATP-binding protein
MNDTATKTADVRITGLTKEFQTADGTLSILRGVDIELNCGEAVAITGPSGSGKSTLLYILGTLESATAGTVSILDADPTAMSEADLAKFRNANIGFIFQDHHLLPQCTVMENVLIPLLAGDGVAEADAIRAKQLLDRVGLGERLEHRPAQLSGGERQRVAVCRALIGQPALLLADEPTGNLDQATAESIGSLLLELSSEQNVLLVCVTHSAELASRFPRHVKLNDGKLE